MAQTDTPSSQKDGATKYHVDEETSWEMEHDIRLSDHAKERWEQRTPETAPELGEAFLDAQSKGNKLPDLCDRFECDRGWLYWNDDEYWGAVLPERNDFERVITTIIRVEMLRPPVRSYCTAVGNLDNPFDGESPE